MGSPGLRPCLVAALLHWLRTKHVTLSTFSGMTRGRLPNEHAFSGDGCCHIATMPLQHAEKPRGRGGSPLNHGANFIIEWSIGRLVVP